MSSLFDKYNNRLCSAISEVCKINVTQMPMTDEQFKDIKSVLDDVRLELYELRNKTELKTQ